MRHQNKLGIVTALPVVIMLVAIVMIIRKDFLSEPGQEKEACSHIFLGSVRHSNHIKKRSQKYSDVPFVPVAITEARQPPAEGMGLRGSRRQEARF